VARALSDVRSLDRLARHLIVPLVAVAVQRLQHQDLDLLALPGLLAVLGQLALPALLAVLDLLLGRARVLPHLVPDRVVGEAVLADLSGVLHGARVAGVEYAKNSNPLMFPTTRRFMCRCLKAQWSWSELQPLKILVPNSIAPPPMWCGS